MAQLEPGTEGTDSEDSSFMRTWQDAAQSLPDLTMLLGWDGRILRANRPPFGAVLDDIIGRNVFDYAPTELQMALRIALKSVFGGRRSEVREIASGTSEGSVRWFSIHAGLIAGGAGEPCAQVVVRDITAQKAAEAECAKLETRYVGLIRREAQLMDELRDVRKLESKRDALVHMLVHDLRSPLTALHFLLTSAAEDVADCGVPVVEDALAEAIDKTTHLSEMISDILDVSRFEDGVMPLQIDSNEMGEIAFEAVAHVAPLKPVGIDLSIIGEPRVHRCDRSVIRRVITNLVVNAVKATPDGGTVCVDVVHGSELTVVSVADQGEDIAPEMQERIFDKFSQTGEQVGQPRGTGLGLRFCKLAVHAHGGEIGMRSEPGQGSTFFFTLPNRPRASLLR